MDVPEVDDGVCFESAAWRQFRRTKDAIAGVVHAPGRKLPTIRHPARSDRQRGIGLACARETLTGSDGEGGRCCGAGSAKLKPDLNKHDLDKHDLNKRDLDKHDLDASTAHRTPRNAA